MNKLKLIALSVTTSTLLSGCGADIAAVVASATTAVTTVTGVALPANVAVISTGATTSNLAAVNYAAFNDTNSDYSNTVADVWLNAGEWQEAFNLADSLVCVMAGTGAKNHANEEYLALVNDNTCFNPNETKAHWASVVTSSTRADNESPQLVKVWFDSTENGRVSNVVANIKVNAGASDSNPWGEFEIDWDFKNLAEDRYWNRGSINIAKNDEDLGFKYIGSSYDNRGSGAETDELWANGLIKVDKSGGKLKVKSVTSDGTTTTTNYKVDFNATHASVIKDSGTASCLSLTNFNEYAHGYNIYTEDGSVVDITSQLKLVFGTDKDKKAWAGQYKSGGTAANPTYTQWMWTEDNSEPTTVYLASDTSVSKSVTWTSYTPTISGVTFDAAISFDNAHTSNDAIGSNDWTYAGKGNFYGSSWSNSTGSWVPATSLADGVQLTATNGVTYRVKRTSIERTPIAALASACTGLDASSVDFSEPTGQPEGAKNVTWASMPTVSKEAKVVHGVDQ